MAGKSGPGCQTPCEDREVRVLQARPLHVMTRKGTIARDGRSRRAPISPKSARRRSCCRHMPEELHLGALGARSTQLRLLFPSLLAGMDLPSKMLT